MNDSRLTRRSTGGFTLVEMMVVIVIISILAAVAIPGITAALRTAKETAIRQEISVVSQALEAYKLEHGSYPPDFSDWRAVEAHFRNAFQRIDNNELRILAQFTHYDSSLNRMSSSTGGSADPRANAAYDHYPHAIDRAEALVFCLGGFSRDERRPFTGEGGPLVLIPGDSLPATPSPTDYTLFQYNTERDTGDFGFETANLSVTLVTSGPTTFTYSDDEGAALGATSTNDLGFVYHPDPFPVFRPKNNAQPLVYFNSRTYDLAWGAGTATVWNPSPSFPRSHHFQNLYLPTGGIAETGVARPYASNVVDTTPPASIRSMTVTGTTLQFVEPQKFQLVSAGLDGNYGGIVAPSWGSGAAGIAVFPSGQYYNPLIPSPGFSPPGPYPTLSSVDKYQDDLCLRTHYPPATGVYRVEMQRDNVTNFSRRTLESNLP